MTFRADYVKQVNIIMLIIIVVLINTTCIKIHNNVCVRVCVHCDIISKSLYVHLYYAEVDGDHLVIKVGHLQA